MSRPREHEEALATPHIVEPDEIMFATRALLRWQRIESDLPVDTREWRAAAFTVEDIYRWIEVANRDGKIRRSFLRHLEVTLDRNGSKGLGYQAGAAG